MSHSMGWFQKECKGNFKKYGKPRNGDQQWRCSRCGRIQVKKAKQCFWSHQWRLDRRTQPKKYRCKKCGAVRTA